MNNKELTADCKLEGEITMSPTVGRIMEFPPANEIQCLTDMKFLLQEVLEEMRKISELLIDKKLKM